MGKTATDDGWKLVCSCGVVVAEGVGDPPTASLLGAAVGLALGQPHDSLGQKIEQHVQESGGGVHRLAVRGRVTEKL